MHDLMRKHAYQLGPGILLMLLPLLLKNGAYTVQSAVKAVLVTEREV